ncbi:hypothetical protein VTP01DRAFT_806 [Rhizomucor pusillus]|uniref:uncharacterized protein n=1 Tax=Rhizomucor pusillus TaxID=4840 RepID=UPI003743280F
MSLYTFFGCLLVAYGPVLSIFFLYIGRNAQHVLLMVSSAFFCLIAILLSSVIWYFTRTRSAISIIYGVLIQELFRWFFFLLTRRAEKGLSTISTNPRSPFNRSLFAFVTGFGYALTSSLVSYIALLVESIGPGVIMCPSCPQASLFFISAVTTTLFSLLHIVWMMNAFEGYVSWNTNKLVGALRILWVIGSHYGASYATLLNSSNTIYLGCVYSIVTCIGILAISIAQVLATLKSRYRLSTHLRRHSSITTMS